MLFVRNERIQLHVEAGHLLYFFYEAEEARKHFSLALDATALKVELTGANVVKACKEIMHDDDGV